MLMTHHAVENVGCTCKPTQPAVDSHWPEEVGHGHLTAYVIVELYGFSTELPVQKWFGSVLAKFCYQYTRNTYFWNPLEKRFQESESTPFNPVNSVCPASSA